ncbi:chromophore lyase CpcT/CpeT [Phormidium sp. CLA17]|uniref:chromophore lyase CpcT/CpeT n=1 Tax=Leptolyngbya sp. Cla-17 TaxID=2803751 RepID=UPI00149187FE|nr:chromophore lyase CpcT/CpeT [Leptolyngbya sp. Cla-17]MBM0740264.1 chromophore lyase CpcT/CpeT [Leptolyngbya sp. Cla-17]MBM0745489.1 chromophore lyase CpcT/CpeT [Leptolyngbya sp. Cla-17]
MAFSLQNFISKLPTTVSGTIAIAYLLHPTIAIAEPIIKTSSTLEQQAEEVAALLVGKMDTSAQAIANPKAPNVQMTTCRIGLVAQAEPQSIFLYQEQAMSTSLDKPYRQRFLEISPSSLSQSVRSRSFKPTDPTRWAGLCDRTSDSIERTVNLSDLGTPVCNVFLKQVGTGYMGNTPVDGCPAKVRGAVRITNHIELAPASMNTWDRGFDAQGKQVWGAKTEAYHFRRQ